VLPPDDKKSSAQRRDKWQVHSTSRRKRTDESWDFSNQLPVFATMLQFQQFSIGYLIDTVICAAYR